MKKYAFYIDSMQMGGAQRVMNNLIDFFVNQGIEIVLINDIRPSKKEPEYRINRHVVRYYLDDVALKGFKKNISRIVRLRKIFERERPELVLSFLGPPNIRMLIATVGMKIKKVVSVRNDPSKEYGRGIKKIIAKTVFLLADGCVFQTEDARRYFFSKTQKNSTVIFNPVNEKFYRHKWKEQGEDIVFIGRLQEQKNPLLALYAFAKNANDFPNHRLVFYGDEELSDLIIKTADVYGLSERVVIAGKTNCVENVLENAALFILSSNYEGMPNALMEAMTVGVPAISTDCPCGGPRMLIQNENQGVLIPCNDVDALAVAIKKLLDDKKLQKCMSMNERKRSVEFHPSIVLERWREYLE